MVSTLCFIYIGMRNLKKLNLLNSQPYIMMTSIKTLQKQKSIVVDYTGVGTGSEFVNANFVATPGQTGPATLKVPVNYDTVMFLAYLTNNDTLSFSLAVKGDEGSSFFIFATPTPSQYVLPLRNISQFTVGFGKVPANTTLAVVANFYNRADVNIGKKNFIHLSPDQVPLDVQMPPGESMSVSIDNSSLPLWVTNTQNIALPEMNLDLRVDIDAIRAMYAQREYTLISKLSANGLIAGSGNYRNNPEYQRLVRERERAILNARIVSAARNRNQRYALPEMFCCCRKPYDWDDLGVVYRATTFPWNQDREEMQALIVRRDVRVIAQPEMEASKDVKPNEGITEGSVNKPASNVVLGETQSESQDVSSVPVKPDWYRLSTTEQCPQYADLTDRWLFWKNFTWTESFAEGTLITHDVLPLAWLNSNNMFYCDIPNFIPFNIHAYWRGDLEVKLHINSNQFQNGMLMMSWLYAADSYDDTTSLDTRYSNVALMVQRPHVKVLAGSSNEATLKIPYRYVRPFTRCKNIYSDTVNKTTPLNLGRLTITPLVALTSGTAANSPKTADCAIFIKLTETKFTGMMSGSLSKPAPVPPAPKFVVAYPEMALTQAGNVIGKVLGTVDKLLGDVNCDNPPMTEPGKFLIPMNAQSWSHGTKSKEPIYTLRLDGRRIGVGRSSDIGYSETEIQRVISVYGLLKPITWSSTDATKNTSGYLLWYMGVHPQCDKDKVYENSKANSLNSYTVPPVGVVSSCFCYWRGSLNFKFDIVATSKHTGRLLVAYIPGITDGSNVTLAQAKASAHIVFSLNEGTTSFTFTVPYIAETMWWPRKYGGPQKASDFVAPSTIVMFVVNALVPMESVAQFVTILPFVCAGSDFEVSVPAQPSIGVATNRFNAIPDKNTVRFKNGYYPVYEGEWRNWYGGKKAILRYGAVSDHVAQLTDPLVPPAGKTYYYKPRGKNYKDMNISIVGGKFPNQGNRTVNPVRKGTYKLGYGVIYTLDGYSYMIPFPITNDASNSGETAAQVLAIALYKKQDLSTVKNAVPDWYVDSDYLTQDNIIWEPVELDPNSSFRVIAEPEMDTGTVSRNETPNVMLPTKLLPTTRFGIETYGESFHDIKDLCRRYQLYWEGTIPPGQVRANKRNAAFVQIPVLAQGLQLEPTLENAVWNNMRDGHIPVLSSGFRFYRGGIRFRIIVTGLKDSIWVQHHPDRNLVSATPIIGKNIHDKDAYRNHSYGFHVQNLGVNRTIEVEIPYYRPGLYSLLGAPGKDTDSAEFASIGDVVIGLEGDQPVTDPIDIAVYYSLADDCSMNIFCGFPSMVYCDEVFKEGGNDVTARKASIDESSFEVVAQPEMLSSFMSSAASSVFGSMAGNVAVKGLDALAAPVARVVKNEVKNNIQPLIKDIETTVAEAAADINSTLGRTLPQQAIITALGQFSQIVLNPSPAAIGVAITTMISNFVVVSVELILTMQDILTRFLQNVWSKYFTSPSDLQGGGVVADAEGFFDEMNDKTLHGFLGLVFASVASTVGISCAKPNQFPNIMKGVKECLNVCNASVVFFRNIVDSIVYMYKYCLGETSDELKAKIIIEREYPHMKDWCEEVMQLLDPRNVNVIMHSSKQANRVFDACMYGAKLIQENLDKNVPGGKVVYDLYTKICKMRDDLIELGNHPDIRFEAFPIWMCGPAGVGKSYMTQEVCKEMLQAIDYRTTECMIYWLALGQKYWNGIKNPPVIARDEAYAVGGQFTEEEIATHLAICSSSILNPPMAALQEKNKRLNPLIYYMNSNLEFPQINEARHPEAIYRRRKILARATYTEDIKSRYPDILDASELPPSEKIGFKHLQFEIARDPKIKHTTWAGPYTYQEFMRIVKEKFVEHVSQERINFRHRMSAAYSLDPEYDANDQLNYVHGTTLSAETLHEQYLRERRVARELLFAPPPTVEDDDYLSSILNRYSYLWRTPEGPQPEMETEDEPSTSSGFYNTEERSMAAKISLTTKMSRGSVLKLISGKMIYSDEDIKNYVIDEHFSDLIKRRKIKMSFGVRDELVSMFPSWLKTVYRQCMWDDSYDGGRYNMKSYIPHWEDLEGVEAIRSYTYWIMRQQQYKSFIEEVLKMKSSQAFKIEMFSLLMQYMPKKYHDMIENAETSEDFENLFLYLDHIDPGKAESAGIIISLLYFMNKVVDEHPQQFCSHCKFWIGRLKDTHDLEYNARYNTVLYANDLGLTVRRDEYCTCLHSFGNNRLYLNSMRIIWNHDHGLIGHTKFNPFSFQEYRMDETDVQGWLVSIWDYVKDWWRCVAVPYVSMMLTFIYEHFGKIIVILLGVYALYSAYNYYNLGKHAAAAANTATAAAKTAVETVTATAAGLIVGQVVTNVDKAPSEVVTANAESNYFKMDKPKAAKSNPAPASRENLVDQLSAFENSVQGNMCYLVASYVIDELQQERKETWMACLALRERQLLVIKHYLEEVLQHKEVVIMLKHFVHGKHCTSFIPRECLENSKYFMANKQEIRCNFALLTLPKYVPMFKNIMSKLVRRENHACVGNTGNLFHLNKEGMIQKRYQLPLGYQKEMLIAGTENIKAIEMDITYTYPVHGPGLCGSLLVGDYVCDGNPGIVALHVAGNAGIGYAEPLYREMFESPIIAPKVEYRLPDFSSLKDSKVELDSNVLMYGCVRKDYAHHESGKSKIVPSLLHGHVYPVKTEPNPLAPGDPRQPIGSDPLRDGCNKHGYGYSRPFPEDLVRIVKHDQQQILLNKVKNPLVQYRELTLQEALCGTTAIPHCEAVNWKSSEGFPLSSIRPAAARNKKYLFDLEESADGYRLKGIDPRLEALLLERQRFRDRNVVFPPIYIDCLKDYRLTPEKCAIPGKTRIFSIAPIQVTIDIRRFMGLYLSGYRSAYVDAQHGIGINPDSLDWTKLANYLHEVGDNIVTGDYSNFGPSLSSQLVVESIDDVIYWLRMNDAPDHIVKNLSLILENEIVNPFHLCSNLVYQTVNGIASGSPITAELNSEVNKYYVKLAFLMLSRKLNLNLTMEDFNAKVRLVTYGDDFIMSVHDDYISWFNLPTIAKILVDYGVVLTDVTKGIGMTPYRKLEESSFLKRTFKKHPTRRSVYLAPIEEMSITECINWCHKQRDMVAATQEVVRASCILAFGHGPQYYKEHTERIHKTALRFNIEIQYPSWEELDKDNFG